MKYSTVVLALLCLPLASCSNLYRGIYEGNTSYQEANQPLNERVLNPAPSFDSYQKEKEKLKESSTAADKSESTEFNLK